MHATRASGLWVQRRLEHGPEDGGRYLAPVEVEAGILQQHLLQLFGELRYFYLLGKQSAIGIGKGLQLFLQILAALVDGRIEHLEQVAQRPPQVLCLVGGKEVVELVVAEHSCILGIETEDDAHAEDIQPAQGFGRAVVVLHEQGIVDSAHYLACLHRHLQLFREVFALVVDEESQAIVVLAQVFQPDMLGLTVGLVHVVDKKVGEVARDNPFGMFVDRHVGHITLGLLEGIEHLPVALLDGRAQILAQRLLLDEYTGGRDVPIDEVRRVDHTLYLLFIAYELGQVLHAKDIRQEVGPEQLALPSLISPAFPSLCKLRCCGCHLLICLHALRLILFSACKFTIIFCLRNRFRRIIRKKMIVTRKKPDQKRLGF